MGNGSLSLNLLETGCVLSLISTTDLFFTLYIEEKKRKGEQCKKKNRPQTDSLVPSLVIFLYPWLYLDLNYQEVKVSTNHNARRLRQLSKFCCVASRRRYWNKVGVNNISDSVIEGGGERVCMHVCVDSGVLFGLVARHVFY